MTSSRLVVRAALTVVALSALAVSTAGCSILARAANNIPPVHVPAGLPADAAQEITRQIEQKIAAREAATAALAKAGLDFPCTYLNGSEGLKEGLEALEAEVDSRASLSAGKDGLDTVHNAYADAAEEMRSAAQEDAVAIGMVVIGTYCSLDQAAG